MKLTKVIFADDSKVYENLKLVYNLNEIKKNDDFVMYKGERQLFKDEEEIILVIYQNFKETLIDLKENYELFKIILVGTAINRGNIDLKAGDIVIPNTFIEDQKDPIFLEYVIGENYDLNKFGLSLNGICLSGEAIESEDFVSDIQDKDSYKILEELKNKKLENSTVVLKEISSEDGDNNFNNILNVLDLIL